MTEEGGGELGTLEVDVLGNAQPLETVLSAIEKRLQAFVKKEWKVQVGGQETAGTAAPAEPRTGTTRTRSKAADQAAAAARLDAANAQEIQRQQDRTRKDKVAYARRLAAAEKRALATGTTFDPSTVPTATRSYPANRASPASATVETPKPSKPLKFDVGTVRKQIEADLAEAFELKITVPEVELKINKASLREQILETFQDLVIDVKANATVGSTPASASQGGGEPAQQPHQQRQFSAGIQEALKKNVGIEQAIHGLYTQLKARAPEGAPFARGDDDTDALGKLGEIADRFGVSSSKLVEMFDETGTRKTGAKELAEGPLGTKALKAQGFEPADAKAVAQQAKILMESAKTTSMLSDFVAENKSQPRQEAPRPAAQEAPATTKEAPPAVVAAERPIVETPTTERQPRKVQKLDDFFDYVGRITGDINPANIPDTNKVMVPASMAKEGELPFGALQAAKVGAGRKQATQGGLGDVQKVLDAASRGAFRNMAYELGNDRKRTGRLIEYNPDEEDDQGRRTNPFIDPITGKGRNRGFLGTTSVERANPSELMSETLKRFFPGIEKQTNPTDPMSSLLNRVMAGSGAAALASQASLPSQLGGVPTGGLFAPGSRRSLEASQIDADRAMQSLKAEVRGQLFYATGQEPSTEKVDQISNAEAQRRATTNANAQKAGNLARNDPKRTTPQDIERSMEAAKIRSQISAGEMPGELTDDGRGIKTSGYFGLFEEITKSNRPLRNMVNSEGGFDKGAIATALEPVDNAMYDMLGLTGKRQRRPKSLDRPENYYIGAERSALINTIYERQNQAQQDLDRRGEGSGGRVATESGKAYTGAAGKTLESVPVFERPTTNLDIENQQLRPKLERDALAVGQARLAKIEAERAASGASKDLFDPVDVGSLVFSPPVRGLASKDTKSSRGIKSDVMRELEGDIVPGPFQDDPNKRFERINGTKAGRRSAEIREIQAEANAFLETIKNIGTTTQEMVGGIEVPRFSPNIEGQRSAAASAGLKPDVLKEVTEVLDTRAAGVARAPGTKAAREPLTGDQGREIFNKAGGLTPAGEGPPVGEPPFTAYNRDLRGGRSDGVGIGGPGGRQFVPGGAPIEVIVVGKFPLPVEISGGSAAAAGAREDATGMPAAGKRRKNAAPLVPTPETPPETEEEKAAAKKAAEDKKYREDQRRRKKLQDRGTGTAVDPMKTYTFDPGEEFEGLGDEDQRGERGAGFGGDLLGRTFEERRASARQAREAEILASRREAPPSEAETQFVSALRGANPSQEAQKSEARRKESETKRLRRQAQINDPVGFSREKDIEDEEGRELRGKLRALNRRIPRRGFGASITDLISSLAPGHGALETQLEAGDLANKEAVQIEQVKSKRAETKTALRSTRTQIADLANAPASPGRDTRLKALTELEKDQAQALKSQNTQIKESTTRFNAFHAEATKGTTVLRSFGAAAAGGTVAGALGVLQFGLGGALTGPIIAAVETGMQTAGSALERAIGYTGTAGRVQTEQGTATLAAGGRSEIAFAQARAQSGLGPRAAAQIEEPITQRAQIEAGNQALVAQVDQFRASQKFREQNKDLLGDAALSQNLTGALGLSIGGTPSAEESITNLLQDVPRGFRGQSGPSAQQLAEQQDRQRVVNERQQKVDSTTGYEKSFFEERLREAKSDLETFTASIGRSTDALDGGSDALDFFNNQAKDAGANIRVAPGGGLDPQERKDQVQALYSARLNRLAEQVKNEQISITDAAGNVQLDPQKLVDELTRFVSASPKPSPDALLGAQKDQIKAEIQTREFQSKLNLGTLLPTGRGIASAAEGDLQLSNRPDLGFTKENLALTKELNAAAKQNRQLAVDFVTLGAPEFRGGGEKDDGRPTFGTPDAGLGAEKGQQFATALGEAAKYSNQINDIQLGLQTKQAALAADQYSYSINIAKRSLQDAKALIGDIAGGTNNLGAIERQNFMLQRQSQTLSLELSQRQINFQRAIANFQAPGLTSEEREARKNAAKIEADFAQKQLNIQKQLFGLAGRSFEVQGRRSVNDQVSNIGLLERGRELVYDTSKAEKQIALFAKKRDKELATVQAIYQEAVDKTQYIIGLSGQLVAATGKDMGELANDVIQAYAKVYKGLIATVEGSLPANPDQYSMGGWSPAPTHAEGFLGSVQGTTSLGQYGVAGEAGGEAVAILRDPQKITMNPYDGGSGGSTQIIINVSGNTVRNDGDLDEIARKVERVMQQRGAQLGLRPFGG